MALPKHLNKYWASTDSREFELLSVYKPFEDNDEWARYRDIAKDQVYTARLEAFLQRFHPVPD